MPRTARKISSSGIYHIVLRGINKQLIFEDDEDYEKLLETLVKYKEVSQYEIYAYCLMGNHFHLLLKTNKEELGLVIKRIAGSYAYWYNTKYKRSGHLFQDRFISEPVENDKYLLASCRYIHQNPLRAGLCKDIKGYRHSSYRHYANDLSHLVDIGYIYSIIGKQAFIEFNNEKNDDIFLETKIKINKINDAEARLIIEKISKCENVSQFQALETIQRDKYINEFKNNGLSIRQISRLTGIGIAIVRKQKKTQ